MNERYIGYVAERKTSNDPAKADNALIQIVAKKNTEKNYFEKLTVEQQHTLCPPNGMVFGPQFFASFNNSFHDSKFIEFSIKEGIAKENINFTHAQYVVDYEIKPKSWAFPKLVPYSGKIEKIEIQGYLSPKELNHTIDKEVLFQNTNHNFFLYDQDQQKVIGQFRYIASRNSIESSYGKEVQIFHIDIDADVINDDGGQIYGLIQSDKNYLRRGSMIDFMTDQQLSEWFRTRFKEIIQIDKTILSCIADFPEAQSLEDDLDISRFERLKSKIEAVNVESDMLVDLVCNHKGYYKQLNDSISEMEQEVKKHIIKEIENADDTILSNKKIIDDQVLEIEKNTDLLQAINSKYETEKSQLEEKLKKDLQNLNAEVESKVTELEVLHNNYTEILTSIKVAVPLINSAVNNFEKNIKSSDFLTRVEFPAEGNAYKNTELSLNSFLKQKVKIDNENVSVALSSIKRLWNYNACLIPNVAWGYLFGAALGNSDIYILHVEYDWLHYKDYCDNGLLVPFYEAYNNQNKNYIIILDGINLTQPEIGLRPLLNVINETEIVIAGFNKPFPKNLKILATIFPAKSENPLGLKLHEELFRNWGAFGDPADNSFSIKIPSFNQSIGYLEPDDLIINNTIEPDLDSLGYYLGF